MNPSLKKIDVKPTIDRIEGDKILLDGKGQFPKKLIIILEGGRVKEYRIIRTRNGKFILN